MFLKSYGMPRATSGVGSRRHVQIPELTNVFRVLQHKNVEFYEQPLPCAGRRRRRPQAASNGGAPSSNTNKGSADVAPPSTGAGDSASEASRPRHLQPPPEVAAFPAREEQRLRELERRREAGVGPGGVVREDESEGGYADFLFSEPKQPGAPKAVRRPAGPHWEDAKRVVMQVRCFVRFRSNRFGKERLF